MSKDNIENITKSDSNFAPTSVDHHLLPDINFNGHCLRKDIYVPKKIYINIYMSYTLNSWFGNLNTDFTLDNYSFESTKLTKNVDLHKYKYKGYIR